MMKVTKDKVQSAVTAFLSEPSIRENLDRLRDGLPERAGMYVVGGAPRNLIIGMVRGRSPKTLDIDVFIEGVSKRHPVADLLSGQPFEKTELGGIRWRPRGSVYCFDICLLPKFVILEKYRLEPTLENLLASIDFDINAVAFDCKTGILYEKECIPAIGRGVMDFNTMRYMNRLYQSYRILLIHYKTGFLLSDAVFSFVKNQIDLGALLDLKSLLRRKVGKRDANAIMRSYDRICSFHAYETYVEKTIPSSIPS